MKKMPPLNDFQRGLVSENITVVEFAIHSAIIVNKSIFGFEYEDLYQEGCIWLCKAAIDFNPKSNIKFSTFATTVVINGLRTYCRLMCNKQKKIISLPNNSSENEILSLEKISYYDPTNEIISDIDITDLFQSLKKQYTGIVKKGIEALELKSKGYSGVEIAFMYRVKPNLVGAWISKAVRKLEKNGVFILWRDNLLDKKVS